MLPAVKWMALLLLMSAPAFAAERTKVLVLDVKSTDLQRSEVETLTSLITAHLSRYPLLEVMSDQDLKRLIDLEAQKQSAGCDEASCLSELAGALGAKLVVYGQAGKLGQTLVVTLNVFDAQKNTPVAREPVEVREVGQLPSVIPPTLDKMIAPLFTSIDSPPLTGTAQLDARGREVFDSQRVDVCVDTENRARWWFCDRGARMTENGFVRKYRETTGKRDLDKYEVNRNDDSMLWPSLAIGGGGALVLASLPVFFYTYVDKTTVPALGQTTSDGYQLGGAIGGTVAVVGLGLGAYGGFLLANALEFEDGEPAQHSMKETTAREAVQRYNDALAEQIAREYQR